MARRLDYEEAHRRDTARRPVEREGAVGFTGVDVEEERRRAIVRSVTLRMLPDGLPPPGRPAYAHPKYLKARLEIEAAYEGLVMPAETEEVCRNLRTMANRAKRCFDRDRRTEGFVRQRRRARANHVGAKLGCPPCPECGALNPERWEKDRARCVAPGCRYFFDPSVYE